MAMVQCGKLWLIQPFHDREYGSINETDVSVSVTIA